MHPDRMAVARQDGAIEIYDVSAELRSGSIPAYEGYVFRLLALDDETLLSVGADGVVRRWQP